MSSHATDSESSFDDDLDVDDRVIPKQKISDRYEIVASPEFDQYMIAPYVEFLKNFYAVSDDPNAESEWLAHFRNTSTVIMGSSKAYGLDELKELRKSMWRDVATRRHKPREVHVFSLPEITAQLMLHGEVEYVYKDGSTATIPWAARAFIISADVDRQCYFHQYQVYLDTTSRGITRPFQRPTPEEHSAGNSLNGSKRASKRRRLDSPADVEPQVIEGESDEYELQI